MIKSLYLPLAVLGYFLALGAASLVSFSGCEDTPSLNCEVHSVDINPCNEAANNEPCRLKRGKGAGISFNFTPAVTVTDMESRAYWHSGVGDLPFVGMDTNACEFTSCTTTPGTPQNYNYTLSISKKFNARIYLIKWRVWEAVDDRDSILQCCFATKIRLV